LQHYTAGNQLTPLNAGKALPGSLCPGQQDKRLLPIGDHLAFDGVQAEF
jgi:hypothetical protein